MHLVPKKLISGLLVFAVTITQVFSFPVANAAGAVDKADPPNSTETIYDLVVIVVDSNVDKDLTSYFGLREKFPGKLQAGTIGERVVRYADDVRKDNDLTDVRVILFNKEKESVVDLAEALENLYVNGDGSGNNRLSGVVLVGDIPLPVVNKAGNRFVSMFPYTDFENKAYTYNPGTESFERNDAVSFPKPEIWHGIIRAPSSGPSGMQKLAEYFDKNHLYYEGEPEYANFDNKLFYADLVHEEENMNGDVYVQYLKYLESWEDLAYMRYNKFWAKELTDAVTGGISVNTDHPDSAAFAAALSTDPLGSLPDIHSKQIIDQFLIPYFKIFGSFLSKTNDFSEYTARYGTGDFDSMPVLISMKDEYSKQYLKKANDALEKQINKVVAKIEEPLPLLEYATLTGEFTNGEGVDTPFAVALSGNLPNQFIGGQTSALYFKYHYLNENTKDFYVNGVDASILENAKQCSVYLGSTKTEYFDSDLNYNPKAVGGEFSILTRALRSDSPLTAQPLQTAGVNTRLLAPDEAYKLTNGAVSSGAVVEDDTEFGMPAFLDNPIVAGNYNNPWSTVLQKGDVIYKMNKKVLGPEYSFEAAIDEAYRLTKRIISATNNGQSQKLTGYPYQIELADNYDLTSGAINRASGIIGLDFYRDGKKKTANITFTVDKDGKTSKHGPAPDGEVGPRAVLVMTENYGGFNFDAGTNGAVFTLYDTEQGFGGNGYDNSAGCNLASAGKNSDRCFPWLASMPVMDPAGSLMAVKTFEPGKQPALKFPEDIGEDDYGQPNPAAYPSHLDVMQFPGGGAGDYYQYEDLDEVYYNSCYFGMPGVVDNNNLSIDSNPIGFALDPPSDGGDDYDINKDFAGRILDGIADFVWSKGNDNELSPDKSAVLTDIDELDAGDIVVNDVEGDVVTLQHFSDRWGIFDGIDNDGDGITDFYWRDLNEDGVFETKWYDLEEASTSYGIPSWNLGEIGRKMLSHNTSYTLPVVGVISPFSQEVTLNVSVQAYGGGKKISSMILHNEPTEHTIFEQVRSQAAFSLPIDNPRYVAFTASPVALPAYPEPKPIASNPPIDVDAIVSKLKTDPYYFPGETVRVDYPNLFQTSNYAQLKSDLSTVAWKITQAYGSYRILGTNASPVNCESVTTLNDSAQCKSIHDEILNKYLEPAVSGAVDDPIDGFELTTAAGDKIIDALKWRDMGIDDKHQYVFEYYLDDAKNAFVGDPTLFPATAGYNLATGYEAAYLVLDGEKDYFDMGFNKDLPEEVDPKFNPIPLYSGTTGEDGGGSGLGAGAGAASGDDILSEEESGGEEDEFEFVDLSQFLKELKDFISFFTTEPDFQESCSFVEYAEAELAEEKGEGASGPGYYFKNALPAKSLKVSVSSDILWAKSGQPFVVSVHGLDSSGSVAGVANDLINLKTSQSDERPALEIADSPTKNLKAGTADFIFQTTGESGVVTFSANTDDGLSSNSVQVSVVGSNLEITSYTSFTPVVPDVEDAEAADGSGDDTVSGDFSDEFGGAGDSGGAGDGGSDGGSDGVTSATGDPGVAGNESSGSNGDPGSSGGSGTSTDAGAGSGAAGGSGSEVSNLESELAQVLADLELAESEESATSGDGSSGGSVGESSVGDGVGGAGEADTDAGGTGAGTSGTDDPTIIILESELVDTSADSGATDSDGIDRGDAVDATEDAVQGWQQYYLLKDYYKKFLINLEARVVSSRMVAEVFSDVSPAVVQTSDEMVADGESSMMVEVVVFDENGEVDHSPRKIKFTVSDSDLPNMISFDGSNVVTSEGGSAKVYIKAGTKAGRFVIRAEALDGLYPIAEKELYLVAGEVTAISIDAGSDVLVANGQSKTKLAITLRDKFGNRANNAFASVALFASGKARLDESVDADLGLIGTQIGTFDGYASVDLLSENEAGEANVIALLLDYDLEEKFLEVGKNWQQIDFSKYVGASKKFSVFDKVDLVLSFDKKSLTADGESVASFSTTLAHGGKVLSQYNGPIKYSIVTGSMGSFVQKPPEKMVNGALHEANVKFKAAKIAGDAEILVEVPGFASQTAKLKILPGAPYKVDLTASDEVMYTGSGNEVMLQARILDKNGNLVDTDNTSLVNFYPTEATSGLMYFTGAQSALALNGVATTTASAWNQSGEVNLYAQVGNLKSGTVSLKVTKRIGSGNVKSWNPRALYTSLLGGDFGNIVEDNNLAQTFLYSGQVQAVSAVSSSAEDKKRIFSVDGYGKIDLMSDMAGAQVIAATDSFPYQKVLISDYLEAKDLAEIFLVPKVGSPVVLVGEEEADGDGIFVERISKEDKLVEFIQKDDGIYIEKNGEVMLKLDKHGRITINDERTVLRLPEEEDGLDVSNYTLVVEDRGQILAVITYKQSFADINGVSKGVNVVSGNATSFYPGIYVKMARYDKRYDFVKTVSRNSSEDPIGVYLVDKENNIDSSQAPGFSYQSLENAKDNVGVGFAGSNKHMLLYAAGNSVGESNMPYASEAGIIFGDPNVRVKVGTVVGLVSELSGYSKDIGKPLFVGESQIDKMIDFDFNGDGYDDLLLMYEDGLVRLLENEVSNKRFRDQGYVLNVPLGIITATKIDVNNDGYSDLIVGTEESCRPDEVCVTQYTNLGGNFVGKTLNLGIEGKAYELKAADLNADGCEDLVVSDSAANIRTFYNTNNGDDCLGLQETYGNSVNFGFQVDAEVNLKDNLYIHYSGVDKVQKSLDPALDTSYKFVTFVIRTNDYAAFLASADSSQVSTAVDASSLASSILSSDQIAGKEIPEQTFPVEFNFINLPEDGRFGAGSFKQAVDMNGESVASGDRIEYRLQLKNTSGSSVSGLRVSDITPPALTLDLESLECLDGCSDDLQWEETGMTARSHVIKNISVPSGGTRTIRYQMVVEEVPVVHFDIGNNFTSYKAPGGAVVAPDELPDIRVRPSVNPDSIMTYLYSQPGLGADGHVKYGVYEELPGGNDLEDLYAAQSDFPDAGEIENNMIYENGLPIGLKPEFKDMLDEKMSKITNGQAADDDFDGCVNSWDKFKNDASNFADSVADGIQNFTSLFRCSGGGCLPIPYNYAFLAPDGPTTGISIFALGVPNPIGFAPFYPSMGPSTFRFYINPTLTMGVGTSACIGAPHAGLCFAFALPMQAMGACPDFLGPINKALSSAKNVISNSDAGMASVVSDGEGSTGSDAITSKSNYGDNGPFSVATDVNIRIPGFPSVLTNWFDKQTDEIYNKLLDLPDFYFIYPDVKTLFSEHALAGANFSKMKNINDFLAAVNSLPLIQIEGREVALKIPVISMNEVQKWKAQANLWIRHHENELERLKEYWTCDISDVRRTLCDKVTVKMTDMIRKVKKFMDKLDQIANLPAEILKWKHAESKYATQIICYLDAIMNYTGGYIRKQEKRIRSWMKALEDAIRTFKDWKVVLDLMAEYQQSCDECKNDRFSKLGLLLSLFIAVPEPPIIPFPKLPDIVFDISQIKTGIKIVWPDIEFIAEPIVLPDLPTINFSEIDLGLPNVVINLDLIDFDIPDAFLDFPVITFPNLPDLPPLPLPKLPDIPRPPKIPKIPNFVGKLATTVKTILKILCLVKKGFVPILESSLGTEIETLTQPSINVVLPIIKNLGFQYPAIEYDYVEQIRIDAKLNMGINTDYIYDAAKKGADKVNKKVEKTVKDINEYTDFPLQQLINGLVKKANEELKEATTIEGLDEDKEVDLTSYLMDNPQYAEIQSQVEDAVTFIDEYVAALDIEETPDSYYLTATEDYLDLSDPILNRSIAQIEADILLENLPDNPGMRQLAEMRDSMIAYTNGLEDSIKLLQGINEYDEFVTMVADTDESVRQFASTDISEAGEISEGTVQTDFFDSGVQETLLDAAGEYGKRYLAANIDPQEALASTSQNIATPKGFYVIVGDKNQNILNYTEELGNNVQSVFSDVDHDKDFDIVYSMGGDVYLKTNYKYTPSYKKGDLLLSGSKSSVSDFVPEGGSMVNGVEVPYESNKKVDISWDPKDKSTYEVVVRRSIDDSYSEAVKVEIVDKPEISLELENGNYNVNIFAINEDGKRSVSSSSVVISPSICADDDAPFPAIGSTEFEIPIFSTLEIDASNSFDTTSDISEYYIEFEGQVLWNDLNKAINDDGKGAVWDDKTDPHFEIGPFDKVEDIGVHTAVLHVVDEAGMSSEQEIKITVYVPKIFLDDTFARTYVANGGTLPESDNMPFSLWRNRYIYRVVDEKLSLVPRIEKVETPSITNQGKYYTDERGEYEITDFDLEDMILVENADGKIVAEIDPETGNIGALADGHTTVVREAVVPISPTVVQIIDPSGVKLGSVYVIGDPNIDATLHKGVNFDASNYKSYFGVNISDLYEDDMYEFRSFSTYDKTYPGGAYLVDLGGDSKVMMVIDAAGNILVLDDRVKLEQKKNLHAEDPLVILVKVNGEIVGEILISLLPGLNIVGPNDVPFVTPRAPNATVFYQDGSANVDATFGPDSPEYTVLKKKGIVDDLTDTEELIHRAEFVKILLNMLCIIPRPAAYQPYTSEEAGGGFSDIQYKQELDWFYPYVKEGALRGFIEGYKGETDPNSGLNPFKAENQITRAEAAKIILEAMEDQGIIDMSGITEGTPWYEPYMAVATDITPYLNSGEVVKNNFIVTDEEALRPNDELTRGELFDMALRVLDVYNCFEADEDLDGMSDFCEEKYAIDDPNGDPDGDNLLNIDECYYNLDPNDSDSDDGGSNDGAEIGFGTDPFNSLDDPIDSDGDGLTDAAEIFVHKTDEHNPDTDGGGVNDGDEVKNLTNPLDGEDDYYEKEYQEGEDGIYIVPADCNSCPCVSTFLNKADVVSGDIFFSVISTYDEKAILSKSNDVIIE